jgi:hypothetical protein
MYRHLQRMDRDAGGVLLSKHVGPDGRTYYTTTLAKLREVNAPWFSAAEDIDEKVETLTKRLAEAETILTRHSVRLGVLTKAVRQLGVDV